MVGQEEHGGMRYTLELPARLHSKTTVRNVCGVLRGSDDKLAKEAVLFTAHLDHIGVRTSGLDRINNGADDDASGVTAVLAIADAYAKLGKKRLVRSTIFATFWGEEKGRLGSRHMADNPPWPLDKIVANVNIEMIGRPGKNLKDASWVTGWNKSDLGPLMAKGAKRVGIKVYEHKQLSAMLYRRSDNYSFVRKGVIAHSFSASSLHKDYHQPGDEWEKIETENMTRVIKGLFAGSLPIVMGLLTPSKK